MSLGSKLLPELPLKLNRQRKAVVLTEPRSWGRQQPLGPQRELAQPEVRPRGEVCPVESMEKLAHCKKTAQGEQGRKSQFSFSPTIRLLILASSWSNLNGNEWQGSPSIVVYWDWSLSFSTEQGQARMVLRAKC